MIRQWIGRTLAAVAAATVKLAAKVAPSRGVDVFTHRMHASSRRWWHFDAYCVEPGFLRIEVAGGTMEIAWNTREELAA